VDGGAVIRPCGGACVRGETVTVCQRLGNRGR
jgi:hypothetical protein